MFKLRSLSVAVISVVLLSASSVWADNASINGDGIRFHGGDEVMLQGFHWNIVREQNGTWYTTMDGMAQSIADLGVTSVWMNPVWRDWSSWNNGTTYGGGEGFMWFDMNKNSQYGSDQELKDLAAELNSKNVKMIYDIVANHRDKRLWEDPATENTYPAWDPGGDKWAKNCWIPCENWGGAVRDDGDPFVGAEGAHFFDLNTAHSEVYNDIKNELINLVNNYGASGFRWDFVRGFSPFRINSWLNDVELATGTTMYSMGELWKDPISQSQLYSWAGDAKSTAFDFELKKRINSGDIFSWRWGLNGNPRQAWRERAITFVGNHDTDYSPGQPAGGQSHWPTPAWAVDHAYAYILSAPGQPTIYWPHVFDEPKYAFLQNMISIRKQAGVVAGSGINFENSTGPGIAATVYGNSRKLKISIGSTWDYTSSGYTLVEQGAWGKIWMEPQSSTTVAGHFFCGNGQTQPGQDVYVVGSTSELGAWDTANAIKLNPLNYPEWGGWIELSPNTAIEWKCIIKDGNGTVLQWEPGSNNTHTTPANGVFETDGMF